MFNNEEMAELQQLKVLSEVMYSGTCAGGTLHVALIQLPLSQQKEVICLSSTPGIIQHVNIWTGCILLK